jgi:dTDP-4-dehydrorhamnose reductase
MRHWHGDELIGLGSKDADIRDAHQVSKAVESIRPDWIVLSAAYTNVDDCETHAELALAVNRDGPMNVAHTAERIGAKLLFVSSDYVFDGKKTTPYESDDRRNPQSIYGRSKAEAETHLLEILPDVCIARTSWLFGRGGKCFPDTILKLAASRPTLEVVSDQRGDPTYSVDLAKAIIELCRAGAGGIVHVTNAGECSWFEFARAIVKGAGLATEVRPVNTEQMARPAPRPPYSVLSPKSLQRYGISMATWQDALQRYLQERKG